MRSEFGKKQGSPTTTTGKKQRTHNVSFSSFFWLVVLAKLTYFLFRRLQVPDGMQTMEQALEGVRKVAVLEAKEAMKKVTKQSILHDLEEIKGKLKGKEKTEFAGLLTTTLWAP